MVMLSELMKRVLVVIVLYKHSLEKTKAYKSLLPLRENHAESFGLFVFDNSPEPHGKPLSNVHYIHNPSNPGVAFAYNAAFNYARQRGFDFLLLMDQDTHFPFEAFIAYSQAVINFPREHVFAPVVHDNGTIISPFTFKNGQGRPCKTLPPGRHSFGTHTVINSGMLISVSAFETCGGYDVSFPMDLSDVVFCERLRKYGYSFILTDGRLDHQHSSNATDVNYLRFRFQQYLSALKKYLSGTTKKNLRYHMTASARALKLALRFRKIGFIKMYIQSSR